MARAIAQIEKEVGAIDILINNAGIQRRYPFTEFPEAEWDKVIDVNQKSVFLVSQQVSRYMVQRRRGKIINICSMQSELGRKTITPYAASKGAVKMLTRGMCVELAEYNIQVNAIAPGAHKTDMYWDAYKIDPELLEKRTKGCPLPRAGEVSEMYHIVRYFLASDFITGQVVSPNGGTTMV